MFAVVLQQENILFEELTGWEALAFYGRLKDLKGAELDREVELRLRQMELWAARHKACGKYSGTLDTASQGPRCMSR